MSAIKREDITGVTIDGQWMAHQPGQTDMQPIEEGLIIQTATGERTLYPWHRIDNLKLV